MFEQRQQFEQAQAPIEQNVPRIRIPVHIPKRAQHISPTKAPQNNFREEIPVNYDDEVTEQVPVTTTTTTTTQAPITRRPLSSRFNFEETLNEAPVRRAKKPHTPIIQDAPQILSNDVEVGISSVLF